MAHKRFDNWNPNIKIYLENDFMKVYVEIIEKCLVLIICTGFQSVFLRPSGQTKDINCCFSAKPAAFMSRIKDGWPRVRIM